MLDDKVRDKVSDPITEGSGVLLQQVYHEGYQLTCYLSDRDLERGRGAMLPVWQAQ